MIFAGIRLILYILKVCTCCFNHPFYSLRQKLKERRVALLGKKCWAAPNDETQPYEATQAFADFTATVRETSMFRETVQILEGQVVRDQEVMGVSCQQAVKEERHEKIQEKDEVLKEERHEVKQENNDKEHLENKSPMEVVEDESIAEEVLEEKTLRSPPVLPGTLERNFKCPVPVLVQDVQAIMAMGFSEEMAGDALVASRGKLDAAVESLLRSSSQQEGNEGYIANMTGSPSAFDLVSQASAVSRKEQMELREEIKGKEVEEDEDEEEGDNKTKPKRKPRGRAKAKAKAKAKGKKGKATAKAKAKSKKTIEGKSNGSKAEKAKVAKGKKAEKDIAETPEQTSGRKTRKNTRNGKKDLEEDVVPKAGSRKRKAEAKKGEDEDLPTESGPKTFARRYIPKCEPLRSVWLAARNAFDNLKQKKTVIPSKLQDWFVKNATNSTCSK